MIPNAKYSRKNHRLMISNCPMQRREPPNWLKNTLTSKNPKQNLSTNLMPIFHSPINKYIRAELWVHLGHFQNPWSSASAPKIRPTANDIPINLESIIPYTQSNSPKLLPLISNDMHCSSTGIYNNIEDALRMITFLVTFAAVHCLYFVEGAFDKYLACLWSFSDGN